MNISNSNYPNLFIIGGTKCGTSACSFNLNKHPDIFIVNIDNKKKEADWDLSELHMFNNEQRYNKGLDFYLQFFTPGKACKFKGEKTPNYLYCPRTPVRIKHSFPNSKFIVIMRNPIDRAFSHWNHVQDQKARYFGKEILYKSFYDTITSHVDEEIFFQGKYLHYINYWLSVFPRENFYFCVQERILANMDVEYNKIFKWLGVDPFSTHFENIHSRPYNTQMTEEEREFLRLYYYPWNQKLFYFLKEEINEW